MSRNGVSRALVALSAALISCGPQSVRSHDAGTRGGAPAPTGPVDPSLGGSDAGEVTLPPPDPTGGGNPVVGIPGGGGSGGGGGATALIQAVQLNLAQSMDFPQVGQSDALFTIIGRLTIDIMASGTSMFHLEICDFQFDSGKNNLVMTVPAPAVKAFPPPDFGVMLPKFVTGAQVVTPQIVELVGWKATNPATDPLPADSSDQRVFDADHDQNPGVTASMTKPIKADLYLVGRAKVQLTGTLQSPDRTTGTTAGLIELSIVDASKNAVPTGPVTATAINDPARNTFLMVSIPGAANQCADILAQEATLFR